MTECPCGNVYLLLGEGVAEQDVRNVIDSNITLVDEYRLHQEN